MYIYIYICIWLYTWAPGVITLSTMLASSNSFSGAPPGSGGPAGGLIVTVYLVGCFISPI